MAEKEMETEEGLPAQAGLVDLDGDDAPEGGVYEIGYHLLPTISEDALPGAVTALTDILKSENATFIGERFPSQISLAYSIPKKIDTKRMHFDTAYFGWVAFEVPKSSLVKIKAALDANPTMLRYLLIQTDKNAVQVAMAGGVRIREEITPTGDIGKPKRAVEEGGEVSEAALDEALQTIASEDTVTEKA